MRGEVGLQQDDFTLIIAAGFWSYAATAAATGTLVDRLGVRRAMLLACGGSAAASLLIGVALSLADVLGRPVRHFRSAVLALRCLFAPVP